MLPGLEELERAARIVYTAMPPTPQYRWPLLCERAGTEVWVKHENHTPIGAFKLRGGLVYFNDVSKDKEMRVVSATRGNHGQSIAFAARKYGLPCTIVVPRGNSVEKNAAMRAFGAELVEHGEDFQAAREFAEALSRERGLHMVPSFDGRLVCGVATYSLELLRAVPELATAYVPIGLGSGICGMVAAREALSRKAEVVGVVSAHARAYAASFSERRAVDSPVSTRIADGMAVRRPQPEALEVIWSKVARIVEVTDAEVAAAMRMLFECTHNVAEGAGAAGLAALFKDDRRGPGPAAFVLSGGNVDRKVFGEVLSSNPREP